MKNQLVKYYRDLIREYENLIEKNKENQKNVEYYLAMRENAVNLLSDLVLKNK